MIRNDAAAAQVQMVTHSISRQAGGLFDAVRRLAQSVQTAGMHVSVQALRDADSERDLASWSPLRPALAAPVGPGCLGFSPVLAQRVREAAADGALIHVHGLWKLASWAGLRAAAASAAPLVISPHGMLDAWALRQSALRKRLAMLLVERRALQRAACIHALCDAEVLQIRRLGIRAPIAVVPNGVDLPSAAPLGAAPKHTPDRQRTLLFLARVHPKKGLDVLVRAFARCPTLLDGWRLVIAGPDEHGHTGEIGDLAAQLGIGAHVELIGPVYGADKDRLLREADAFVLPSHSEGFPIALLEAMAYTLPVLMTPACNFPEAVDAGAAIAAEPRPDRFAAALRDLLAQPAEALRDMGHRGHRLVAEHYTWAAVAARMVSLYAWAAERAPKPEWVRDA